MQRIRCITLDRQYGSGGREVAKLLSQKLKIPFYDRELLMMAAEKFGLNPGVLEELDERKTGSLLHDIALFAGGLQNYDRMMEPYERYQAIGEIIKKLALEGPCIFVGHCADAVLKDICECLNVFIYASEMNERMERAQTVDGIDARRLEGYIRKKDEQRRTYCKCYSGKEWGNMENYDLCLNTSRLGYEGCADFIAGMMK